MEQNKLNESNNNLCKQQQCNKPEPCNPKLCYKKYVQPCRPKPCKPLSNSFRNEGKIAGNTVYSSSYATYVCGSRQKPIKQNDHLVMAGEFDCLTVNRVSTDFSLKRGVFAVH
ncbi:uncharacterized protein LOC112689834, partial [Sipha flava]|uniref:Uncharacterized protein LOC112689834 n=1 Tax=Sipha flava TaxID=143950 RepID=A0A8B8G9Q6_9HEMI